MAVIYEQLPDESDDHYKLFLLYRRTRSVTEVARRAGYSRTHLHKVQRDWRWDERCRAFDDDAERKMLAREHRLADVETEELRELIDDSLRSKLALADDILKRELESVSQKQASGEPVDLLELKRLLSAIADADSLARRSAGMPTAYRSATSAQPAAPDQTPATYYVGGADDEKLT